MPEYKFMIQGVRVPPLHEGSLQGFYTTRFVQALNLQSAELKAVDLINNEITSRLSVDELVSAGARMFLRKIIKIKNFPKFRGSGATWFRMDDPDGGQAALEMELDAFWN